MEQPFDTAPVAPQATGVAQTDPGRPETVPGTGYRNRPVSWVRRGVRMTGGQEEAWKTHGDKYLIEPPRGVARESIVPGWVLDPAAVFANADAPVIVEIGTGRGENIVAAAAADPDTNFLGVEVYRPGLARAILRAESDARDEADSRAELGNRAGVDLRDETATELTPEHTPKLPNLKLIAADAPELLASLLAGSLKEVWVFFPDPWPKARHQKRRLIDDEFAAAVSRVLEPGGVIRIATDWAHYAEQVAEAFGASSSFENLASHGDKLPRYSGRVLTAFEYKGLKEGRQITDLAYRRR
ncbi:MAG: tRNA (guanine(46)-N(7))-methyltransferase TrmB [Promicromonosporaceae bacterium]|nr:tRNA (guanine(46)-N(7))-methyltransferase TrmB [Promicromonosporaceae bacterium]